MLRSRRLVPNVESAIPLFLVGLFLASGFYDLPFVHLNVHWVHTVKNLLYILFAGLLLLGIDWRQVRYDVFAAGCLLAINLARLTTYHKLSRFTKREDSPI